MKKTKRTAAQIAATKRMMAANAAKRAAKKAGHAVPKGRAGKKRATLQPTGPTKKPKAKKTTRPKRKQRPKRKLAPGISPIGSNSSASTTRRKMGAAFI